MQLLRQVDARGGVRELALAECECLMYSSGEDGVDGDRGAQWLEAPVNGERSRVAVAQCDVGGLSERLPFEALTLADKTGELALPTLARGALQRGSLENLAFWLHDNAVHNALARRREVAPVKIVELLERDEDRHPEVLKWLRAECDLARLTPTFAKTYDQWARRCGAYGACAGSSAAPRAAPAALQATPLLAIESRADA